MISANLSTQELARDLLGKLLIHQTSYGLMSAWIVETEAYVGIIDQACHSYQGKKTPRLLAMYEQPGTIYLYQMHGHILLNIVSRESGNPQAVLIRAVEPFQGENLMFNNRSKSGANLTNGPGKLTQAMDISMAYNSQHLKESNLSLDLSQSRCPKEVEVSPRIGIPNKGEWTNKLLRYTVKGNPYVSKNRGTVDKINHGWLRVD